MYQRVGIQSHDENGGKAIGMQTSLPYARTFCLGLIRGREGTLDAQFYRNIHKL